MPELAGSLLLLIFMLQVKHMFADFFLQTAKMLCGRAKYLHGGRAQHAGVHALGSALAFLVMAAPGSFILTICALEWLVHFHIDYGKARYSDSRQLTPQQAAFWRAAGVDQALHHLTYVAMAAAWIIYAT